MNGITFFILLAVVTFSPAQAEWVLNGEDSTISFVSTKAVTVAEVHTFATLEGSVDAGGRVEISINLSSVKTGIELRDDRMREMLFETETFAAATMTARVDAGMLEALASGDSATATVDGELALHGETIPMVFDVLIARTGNTQLLVISEKPVVVNASLFNLGDGVERLREVAGLPSISTAVPVSFVLSFDAT